MAYNIISTNGTGDLRYLLGSPLSAPDYYDQIKASFPSADVYKIFAEPIVFDGGRRISWSSSYPGKAVAYTNLSDREKDKAQDMLNEAISRLLEAVDTFKDPKLLSIFKNCIEIPSLDSLFIVDYNGDKHAVVIEWGFIQDFIGSPRNVLQGLVNIPRVPMRINVVYEDDRTPAHNEAVVFDCSDGTKCLTSDENGCIVLENIKVGSVVTAYAADDDTKSHPFNFVCEENGDYALTVTSKGDMIFQIVDQNGIPQYNLNFCFEYEGIKISSVSNADGCITLEHMKGNVQVEAYMMTESGEKKYSNFFEFKRGVNPYRIVIETAPVVEEVPPPPPPELPQVSNMRIKVVDDKGNVLRNAPVIVRYLGKKETMRTDESGYVILYDLPVGTVVEAEPK